MLKIPITAGAHNKMRKSLPSEMDSKICISKSLDTTKIYGSISLEMPPLITK
jgi:hypothetical protein